MFVSPGVVGWGWYHNKTELICVSKQKGASACFHKGSCVSQVSLPYSCIQSDNTELLDFFQKNVSEIIFWRLYKNWTVTGLLDLCVNCLEVTKRRDKLFNKGRLPVELLKTLLLDIFINTWREEMNEKRIERIIESWSWLQTVAVGSALFIRL